MNAFSLDIQVSGKEHLRIAKMKLVEFRITNYRSIDDTGWCTFSTDGATVLVGQNESGKTSVLSALATTFQDRSIEEDDLQIGSPLPNVYLRVETTSKEILDCLVGFSEPQLVACEKYIEGKKGKIEIAFLWKRNVEGSKEPFDVTLSIADEKLIRMLSAAVPVSTRPTKSAALTIDKNHEEGDTEEKEEQDEAEEAKHETLTENDVALALYEAAPEIILFEQISGLLPDRIDIVKAGDVWKLEGLGAIAAENFLLIAGVQLDQLVNGDGRTRQNILNRANSIVTANFATFWSQTIGKKNKLDLKCDYEFYGPETGPKAGKPHLVFWISDGLNQLYPKQRSTGVRWFVSFYLQLQASNKNSTAKIFLLDEPGANLHSKAQSDVLKLINRLSSRSPIIYSTHSPHLVEYDKLYRVLAVQREGDDNEAPTSIVHAHKLGAASRDTLSPLLTAMGADLSHQQVIQKHNNVILEEISGFYYLKSFWHLLKEKQEAHFIAATGASNIELLANMFLGWGLEFVVAVDDDSAGRSAFNSLKRHMFGDDEAVANSRMLKINGKGIEDIFDKSDFCRFVLGEDELQYETDNSQYVKSTGQSKVILAYQFCIKASKNEIKFSRFSDNTKRSIQELVSEISERLKKLR